jgi:hypothetical protein
MVEGEGVGEMGLQAGWLGEEAGVGLGYEGAPLGEGGQGQFG